MKRFIQVVCSCFVGAYVGRQIMLSQTLLPHWLSFVWVLLGGLIGWIVCELGAFVRCAKHAWRYTKVELPNWLDGARGAPKEIGETLHDWGTARVVATKDYMHQFSCGWQWRLLCWVEILAVLITWCLVIGYLYAKGWLDHGQTVVGLVFILSVWGVRFLTTMVHWYRDMVHARGDMAKLLRKESTTLRSDRGEMFVAGLAAVYSPIGVVALGVYLCIKNLFIILKKLYIMAHSDLRTVCFIGAAGGVAVSWIFGWSALGGGITGAVIGGIEYIVATKVFGLVSTQAHAHS